MDAILRQHSGNLYLLEFISTCGVYLTHPVFKSLYSQYYNWHFNMLATRNTSIRIGVPVTFSMHFSHPSRRVVFLPELMNRWYRLPRHVLRNFRDFLPQGDNKDTRT